MKKIIMTCVFWLLMAALLATPLVVIAQSSGDFMDPEEFETRLNEAVELTDGAKCSLPNPFLEDGYPITMSEFDDWTRSGVCIDNNQVLGIGYSAWPGDITNKTQHFKAWWRLVNKETLEIVDETITDTIKDPRVSGPPKGILDWSRWCGPEREMVLLLDISARQIINGVEIGLENRDHSWHFTLPQTICKIFMPLVSGGQPPEENPECPDDTTVRSVTPNDGDDIEPYTEEGATPGFTYTVYPGQPIDFYTEINGRQDTVENGEITVYAPGGVVAFEFGDASHVHLEGGTDLGNATYTLEASLITKEGVRCWNYFSIYDPPAEIAYRLIDENPSLSWEEAYSLALEEYIKK